MIRGRTALYLCTTLTLCGVMLGEPGCTNKQLSSSSSDQSMTTKDKASSETVQPDRIVSIEPHPGDRKPRVQETPVMQVFPTTPGGSPPSSSAASLSDKSPAGTPDITGIGDIYFDFDQYNIRTDAQTILERNGHWMRNESGKSLLIEGHCDERGTLAYNLVLGEKRAQSAKRYLENLGIPVSRLHTTSYGEVKPSCKEHNESCWKYNRRAHFVVQ